MRLSTDIIKSSPSFINCVTERELDLRGRKIPTIENMGVALENDAIDLTDNDIAQLGNFPLYPRLRTLFLAQNRITNIQANIASTIPNLTTLVLTKNRIEELADLDSLQGLRKLVYLTLVGNPVTRKQHYRYWVIWRLPSVRFLDFSKVMQKERERAEELFGSVEEPTELATKIMGIKSKGFSVTYANGEPEKAKERIWTDEEKRRVAAAIKNARSLFEIEKLEKDFAEGRIPPPIEGDTMEE